MADIVLKDRDGNPITYPGVNAVQMVTADGSTQTLLPGEAEEKTVDLDFSAGGMTVTPSEGKLLTKVNIPKPANLAAENIAEGVDIAGIVGTLAASGGASNICMATYTAGYSYVALSSSVTLIPKEDLDKIGFGTATKKFAIMIATNSGGGIYGYYIPAIIAQTNYAISSAGISSYAYGVKISRYKTSQSASYTSATTSHNLSNAISSATDGWMCYNNYGLQYNGGSTNPLFATTYIIIAGVIS